MLSFTDRSIEQELGDEWLTNLHPHDLERCTEIYDTAFARRQEFYMEFRLRRHDGVYRWLADKGVPRFTNDGIFEGFIGACTDIHDEKIAREQIQKSELLFKTISNAPPVGLWMTDAQGQCTFVNDTWVKWTGVPFEEQMGFSFLDKILEEDKPGAFSKFLEAQAAQEKITVEFRIRRPDGSVQWCLVDGSPYYELTGNFAGYAGSVTDITEKKMVEVELERKIAERTAALEKSNSELEQFAYVASHDLQEPLRKIKFFTERLETLLPPDAQAKDYFAKIQRSSDRMNTLIKDMLDFSRLSTTHARITPVNLNLVLENVLHDFELLIQQKNASVEVGDMPEVEGVALQMQQLFFNLVNNALKFSKADVAPKIMIKSEPAPARLLRQHKLDTHVKHVHISISDNGIGFEQEYAEQIFVIFQRLNDMYSYAGTGIGLALCKKIVLNHKGAIFAEAIDGNGAVFHILLPLKQ